MALLTEVLIGEGEKITHFCLMWPHVFKEGTRAGLIGGSHLYFLSALCSTVAVPEIGCHHTAPAPARRQPDSRAARVNKQHSLFGWLHTALSGPEMSGLCPPWRASQLPGAQLTTLLTF
jgi:hypothetical protein